MEVHELAGKIDSFAKETREDLAVIKRGVYGDPANGVKGLIQRQDADEIRMDEMDNRFEKSERKQWKLGVFVGMILIGIEVAWNYFKDKA